MSAKTTLLPLDLARGELLAAAQAACEPGGSLLDIVLRLVRVIMAVRTLGRALLGNPRSGREALSLYLVGSVGRVVHTDELDVVSGIGDYGRRVRELRDLEGAPVLSGASLSPRAEALLAEHGIRRPGPKEYVLLPGPWGDAWDEARRSAIPAPVRRAVLARDREACCRCGWSPRTATARDPRRLEVHHVVRGGKSEPSNLVTLCTRCHAGEHPRAEGRGKLSAAGPAAPRPVPQGELPRRHRHRRDTANKDS